MIETSLVVLSSSLAVACGALIQDRRRRKADISAARAKLADKERLVEDLREENRLLRRDIRSHVDSANADEDAIVTVSTPADRSKTQKNSNGAIQNR